MSKTITMESLTPDAQRALEELLASDEPVLVSRGGQPFGRFEAYNFSQEEMAELTPEEEADTLAAIQQGEDDIAAGRYITLEDFERKYAGLMKEDTK